MIENLTHLILLTAIMIIFGILGGWANYLRLLKEQKEAQGKLVEALVHGVIASFLVPLFLSMISSRLIEESKGNLYQLFIFSGFCVLAAISSKPFIDSLTRQVLKRVEENEQKVNEIRSKTEAIEKDIRGNYRNEQKNP